MLEEFEKRREELLDLNTRAWSGDESVFVTGNMDTSIKKNSALIKKIRVLNHDSQSSILKDISTTSLTKYLSELTSATIEGLVKCKKDDDVQAAVEIVSVLHQRFSNQYTPYILSEMLFEIANPPKSKALKADKEEMARINRQKVFLRLITEFSLVGILQNYADEICDLDMLPGYVNQSSEKSAAREPLLLTVIKEIVLYNYKAGLTISLVTIYLKKYAHYFLDDDLTFMSGNTKEAIVAFFDSYTDLVFNRAVALQQALKYKNSKHDLISMKIGKTVDGIELEIEDLEELFEKFKLFSQFLADTFNKDLPDFKISHTEQTESIITMVNSGRTKEHDSMIWETEEIKKFYTEFPDISSTISQEILNYMPVEQDIKELESDGLTLGAKMTKFLEILDSCGSLKDVDNSVYEFWDMNLNNKASKNRLLKFLKDCEETSKLKYLARFIAINSNQLPEVKNEMITFLDGGFRSQLHSNKLILKNIIFFCELIKFKLIPVHLLFHKIRSLILNMSVRNNIEILGIFFENCGKLLMHDVDYKDKMADMLDLLNEKRKKMNLSTNDRYAIDMMLLILKPPAVKQLNKQVVKLSPEEEFLIILIRSELNMRTWSKTLSILQKFDFQNNGALFERLKELFTTPDQMNFSNIPALAKVIKFFTNSSRKLKIYVVDTMIEKIQRNLELNDYRFNRLRISDVTLLACFVNEELIYVNVAINTMYRILCYGHPNNNPMVDHYTAFDPPDNYFRVSLVCQILVTLDQSKFKKKQLEKIEIFLYYLDYYCHTKAQPIPMDTNFKIVQMYQKVNPGYTRAKSLKEAAETLQGMMSLMSVNKGEEEEEEEEEEEGEEETDAEPEIVDEPPYDEFDDKFPDEDSEDSESDSDEEEQEENDDEDEDEEDGLSEEDQKAKAKALEEEYERKLREAQDKLLEESLEKEMKKMIIQSIANRKYSNISRFNAPIPSTYGTSNDENTDPIKKKSTSFMLLSKNPVNKDKKQLVFAKRFELSNDVNFASRLKQEEERQRTEKERIKRFVLNMKED